MAERPAAAARPAAATASPGAPAHRAQRRARLMLGAIVLLAVALRFPTLSTQSIWFDEAATWELMRMPFGQMLSELPSRESNPPLFYVLEWLWTRALGDSEFGLRSLSAVVGTLTVPVAYAIGRRIGGVRSGLAAAALVAVNPLLVWFSQEARSYELVVFLGAASLLLFLRALDDDRPRALAAWAAVSALALCSHYFAVFLLAPQVAWLAWRHPRRRAVAAAVGGIAVVALALLPMLLEQRANPYDFTGIALEVRLLQVPKQFLLGYRGPLGLPSGLLGAALIAGGLWLLARCADRAARDRAVLVGAIGAIGVVLPLAAALLGADYLNARNLIPALVPLVAAIGAGFAVARPPVARLGTAMLAVLCALSVAIVVTVSARQEYQRPDWKGLARALGSSPEERVLVISPANGEAALRYYRRGLRMLSDAGATVRAVDVVGVAGSSGPGDPPVLPTQYGTSHPPGLYAFGPPTETKAEGYVILRFRQPQATLVQPLQIATVRFSERPPTVATLPPGP